MQILHTLRTPGYDLDDLDGLDRDLSDPSVRRA